MVILTTFDNNSGGVVANNPDYLYDGYNSWVLDQLELSPFNPEPVTGAQFEIAPIDFSNQQFSSEQDQFSNLRDPQSPGECGNGLTVSPCFVEVPVTPSNPTPPGVSVPEPPTALLLLFGFALVGLSGWFHRKFVGAAYA